MQLGRAAPNDAVEVLGLTLKGTSFDRAARIEAIRGLGQIGRGNRRAEEILEGVLRDTGHTEEVRNAAQAVLNQLYQN